MRVSKEQFASFASVAANNGGLMTRPIPHTWLLQEATTMLTR